jgi:hypothetical protein
MSSNHAASPDSARSLLPALRDMLALLGVAAAAWLIHVYGRVSPTAVLAAVWAGLTAAIAVGLFRRARIRRAAILSAYLRASSPLERRLRGGWLMAARESLLAGALALLLMVALVRLANDEAWIVLIASVPLLVGIHRLLRRAFASHVSPAYLPELTWRVTLAAVGMLMLIALVWLAYHRAYPDLGAVSLERAVWHMVDQERARSGSAEVLLQMAAAKDALRLWIAQQLMPQPGTSLAQALGWLAVLAEEAVFVWSYLLLCSAVLIGIDRNERSSRRET